jgi:capsule biosynthesis phosphatase
VIAKTNVLVVDVDGTLCPIKREDQEYEDLLPDAEMVARLRELVASGWRVIIQSSRNMNSFEGNIGAINATTLPVLVSWLERHSIPYDEIHVGKPWPGDNGFYVDDRAVRPREFLSFDLEELRTLCDRDRAAR